MTESIALQWWQLLALLALSAYALMHLLILPVLQAYIYRRSRRTERMLEEELDFGLSSYTLANRQIWLDRLINDPGVQQTMDSIVGAGTESRESVVGRTREYAEEIVPSFNVLVYFRFGYALARIFLRIYYWISVVHSAEHEYDGIPKDSLVVLVSNHRSNFDPLLMIYMASRRAPVSYSAGEWALSFPFQQILHAIGFYIVRREGVEDPLYRRVLERYVFLVSTHCVPQGLFLEGALSRDGTMQPLKTGMLNYLVKAYGEGGCKDIVFVPAALNYDKIPEDRTLLAHRDEGFARKGRLYSLLSFLRFFVTVITYVMPRRHKPFGYACVNFGKPLSLSEWQETSGIQLDQQPGDERRGSINTLGDELAGTIRGLIPVLPTNVLGHVLSVSEDLPLSEIELKMRALQIFRKLAARAVPVVLPNNDEDYALGQGIYVLLRRKVIRPTGDGRFEIVEAYRDLLHYYRDTISHYLTDLESSSVGPDEP